LPSWAKEWEIMDFRSMSLIFKTLFTAEASQTVTTAARAFVSGDARARAITPSPRNPRSRAGKKRAADSRGAANLAARRTPGICHKVEPSGLRSGRRDEPRSRSFHFFAFSSNLFLSFQRM
jgi:hypothetical protein